MLTALVLVFSMSHAFRTVAAIMATPLQSDLGLSTRALGFFSGSFHLAFAAVQPAVGVALDRWGPRRTVLVAFAVSLLGSLVSAIASDVAMLVTGQVLIGIGCAPALLAAMVFITRRYPRDEFARRSGYVLGLGGLGMLITTTPLAWVIDHGSWRAGFLVLSAVSVCAWLAVFLLVDDEAPARQETAETLAGSVRELGAMLLYRHSVGIICLAGVTYAATMSLRGLWLGPLLTQRHGFSVVDVGHVALAASLVGVLTPIAFGYLNPSARGRRFVILGGTMVLAANFAAIGFGGSAAADVVLAIGVSLVSGYISLQYADLRAAYPPEQIGRALSLFTMAMFGGIAAMQWLTGVVASAAASNSGDPLATAMFLIAGLLIAGAVAYWLLPWPCGMLRPATSDRRPSVSSSPDG